MKNINYKGIPTAAKARMIVYLMVIVNQIAVSVFDFNLFPFEEAELYEMVTAILTGITMFVAAYKDTPVTPAGQEGHKLTKNLKGGK